MVLRPDKWSSLSRAGGTCTPIVNTPALCAGVFTYERTARFDVSRRNGYCAAKRMRRALRGADCSLNQLLPTRDRIRHTTDISRRLSTRTTAFRLLTMTEVLQRTPLFFALGQLFFLEPLMRSSYGIPTGESRHGSPEKETRIVATTGVGFSKLPIRLLTPPEIVVVDLVRPATVSR